MEAQRDATHFLLESSAGDRRALDRLVPLVYEELRRLAHQRLLRERGDHTLSTTALVHETYLRLVDVKRVRFADRAHFLAMASRLMRRVLVDHARRRNALKRGGGQPAAGLEEPELVLDSEIEPLLELDQALTRLEEVDPRQREILEHRYFGGLTLEETAEAIGVSVPTVKRDLRVARAWLAMELGREPDV